MDQRTRNNLRADAVGDQAAALVRDGQQIPDDMDLRATVARMPTADMPEGLREISAALARMWAEETDVDVHPDAM